MEVGEGEGRGGEERGEGEGRREKNYKQVFI